MLRNTCQSVTRLMYGQFEDSGSQLLGPVVYCKVRALVGVVYSF